MKTTLVINDQLMRRLKQEAARQKRTMSEMVEAAIRMMFFSRPKKTTKLKPLPSFHGGDFLVDISNRDELYRVMEEED